MTPLLGIWWDDGVTCAALTESPDDLGGLPGRGLLDSEMGHVHEWDRVARRFNRSPDSEYFLVPRGRVLLRPDGGGLILHGNGTPPDRLAVVAAEFGLTAWTTQTDDHYAVGEEAERVMGEWFEDWE